MRVEWRSGLRQAKATESIGPFSGVRSCRFIGPVETLGRVFYIYPRPGLVDRVSK
jgi:hypothetical protein